MLTAIPSSSCKQPGYVCNKKMITDAKTAEAYEKNFGPLSYSVMLSHFVGYVLMYC